MNNFIPSRTEMEDAITLDQLKRKEITQAEAAKAMGISARWVRTKLKRYIQEGLDGLIHKNRGKESKKKWKASERQLTIDLLKSTWQGFGPTFTADKLKQLYSIKVDKETVRQMMIKENLWVAGQQKSKHRKRRERKECFGMLIQVDGSPHDWFEGRGHKCTLLLFIDDATGRIWAEFAKSESINAVMKSTINYLKTFGRPIAMYTDYGSVFSVNLNNKERDKITQYERALSEMEIELKRARSPQAKGRVERSFGTHQDRLVKELRLANISTMDTANIFLKEVYFKDHNNRFAVEPAQSTDVHKSIEGFDLENVFCIKDTRKVANDFTIQYKKRIFQIERNRLAIVKPKDIVTINEHLNGTINIFIRRSKLNFYEIRERSKPEIKEVVKNPNFHQKPSKNSKAWVIGKVIKNNQFSSINAGAL
jgi:transposase